MKFKLNETFLTEGKNIERTWEQYKDKFMQNPYIDSEEMGYLIFQNVIGIDPTFREGATTTGDYGIWILNRFVDGNLKLGEDDSTVRNLLDEFSKKKPNLEKRDINQYKTIEELSTTLQQTDYSDRQKERQLRHSYKDAKLLLDGKDWEIWIPETYEASCTLGAGTDWCTADTRTRSHYDSYLKKGGKFYIIINKKNPKEKYQFHFESKQFMDKEDHGIDYCAFLLKNPEVGEVFKSLGYWQDWSECVFEWDGKSKIPSNVTSVKILPSVETIEGYSFVGLSLKSIEIPSNVKTIGSRAFGSCKSLESIIFNEGLLSIGERCFSLCKSLKTIDIPYSVTDVGIGLFSGCDSLEQVSLSHTLIENCKLFTNPKHSNVSLQYLLGIESGKTKVIYK